MTAKNKQSIWLPKDILEELKNEANRQDRALSWLIRQAWKIAKQEIKKYPSATEFDPPGDESTGRNTA